MSCTGITDWLLTVVVVIDHRMIINGGSGHCMSCTGITEWLLTVVVVIGHRSVINGGSGH